MTLYAHSGVQSDKSDWQTLEDHLKSVGDLAAKFSKPFGVSAWARAAGVLHDAGKARCAFQLRLDNKHPPIDHSIVGARLAMSYYPNSTETHVYEGAPLAPIIAGHHGGLPNGKDLQGRIERDAREHPLSADKENFADFEKLLPEQTADFNEVSARCCIRTKIGQERFKFNRFLLEHLLFSSVVDADWLDTERVMSPEDSARRQAAVAEHEPLDVLLSRLEQHLDSLSRTSDQTPVNQARADMLACAREKSSLPSGIFSLSMPTGSGKTLTSLDFALRHAVKNGQRRVIYAIPFMSIVEQTSGVFKGCLGDQNVLEHFSAYDYGLSVHCEDDANTEKGLRERMLVQNWDAPVVVTTNVQLFESIFSNKASRSRKVHNIANSVIVLDEVQCLPDRLLQPTLAALEGLTAMANVSVVFCTATQPGLEDCYPFPPVSVTEIIDIPHRHLDVFSGRTMFDVSHAGREAPLGLNELVRSLSIASQSLCIVSSRSAAARVFDAMSYELETDEGLFHLSAYMVPAHREAVLNEVRKRLRDGLPCRVVSTQLVEAGVDVDFPLVYRETTGLDSILQAAGRCNREGRRGVPGLVVVFSCDEMNEGRRQERGWLSRIRALGEEAMKMAISEGQGPVSEEAIRKYFRRRHETGQTDGADGKPILGEITRGEGIAKKALECSFDYETIAKRYRFIDDETVGIFVPWGEQGEAVLALLEKEDINYQRIFPLIQRMTINVRVWVYNQLKEGGFLRSVGSFPVPVLDMRDGAEQLYDSAKGLVMPGGGAVDDLIV